ncbi:MAG: DUF2723 domain-containing protein [Chloroflexota bacterium]
MRASQLERPLFVAVVTAAAAFAVYALSLAPDLTWANHGADGAELITAAVTLGVPHPPGYPLYVILGKLFSFAPLGTVAFRFNLLSAICMALAAGLISALVAAAQATQVSGQQAALERSHSRSVRLSRIIAALCAGLCFAFLPLVWEQAIIAEVYAMNMLVVSLALWFMFRPQQTPRVASLMGVALGLAVTTHLTSLFLLVPAAVALPRRRWKQATLGMLAGLSPLLTLPIFASGGSPVVWGRVDNIAHWWWIVSARLYRPNVLSLPADAWRDRLAAWSGEPTLWIAVALLLLIFSRRQILLRTTDRLTTALLLTTALYIVYAFGYDANDALVVVLPALAILCLLAGLAFEQAHAVYLLLPLALLVLNFQEIDLSNYTEARALAELPLREAPQNAIIVTTGDHTTFSLWYLQHVEGQRRDVVIIDSNLLAFDWYRTRAARAHPSLRGLERDDLSAFRQLNEGLRPWCELHIDASGIRQYRCEDIAT